MKIEEIEEDLSHFAEKGTWKLGVPKEIFPGEKRVAIVPQTVRKLVKFLKTLKFLIKRLVIFFKDSASMSLLRNPLVYSPAIVMKIIVLPGLSSSQPKSSGPHPRSS